MTTQPPNARNADNAIHAWAGLLFFPSLSGALFCCYDFSRVIFFHPVSLCPSFSFLLNVFPPTPQQSELGRDSDARTPQVCAQEARGAQDSHLLCHPPAEFGRSCEPARATQGQRLRTLRHAGACRALPYVSPAPFDCTKALLAPILPGVSIVSGQKLPRLVSINTAPWES